MAKITRSRIRKGPREKDIENLIIRFLNSLPNSFAWKNNSTGIFDPTKGTFRANKNKNAITGVSDILGLINGRLVAIEVKKPNGRANKNQLDFINKIKENGGISFIATSLTDVMVKLGEHGIETEILSKRLPERNSTKFIVRKKKNDMCAANGSREDGDLRQSSETVHTEKAS